MPPLWQYRIEATSRHPPIHRRPRRAFGAFRLIAADQASCGGSELRLQKGFIFATR
jgi:hypothetical protein